MTEHITIKKIRNKANAKRLKERYKRDYINRLAGKVIHLPADEFPKYAHLLLEDGRWSIYDFCGR